MYQGKLENLLMINENTTFQNQCVAGKTELRRNFTTSNTYIRKEEMPQINNLSFYIKYKKKEQNTTHSSSGEYKSKL